MNEFMKTSHYWRYKGNDFVKEKKYKEALDCYSKAIEIVPDNPIFYSIRSVMHSNLNEFDQAIADAEMAISLKPDYSKAYLSKGKALELQQRIEEALDCYELGLKKDKENSELLQASVKLKEKLKKKMNIDKAKEKIEKKYKELSYSS